MTQKKKKADLGQTLSELEETVRKMESRETGLAESIKLYEKAVALVGEATELLSEYKGKITVLTEAMNSAEEKTFRSDEFKETT
mgnify:FL=1